MEVKPCIKCGQPACICQDRHGMWAAHCTLCNNSIGLRFHHNCAKTEKEAEELWNALNALNEESPEVH